jgi:hypothetical protein
MAFGDESQGYDNAADAAIADSATDKVIDPSDNSTVSSAQAGSDNHVQPFWNAEEYALNVGGQRILPKSKENIIQWASQGYNYGQKTNEIKQKMAEIKEKEERLSQYEQLNTAFEKNPGFRDQIFDLYKKTQNGTATQQQENQVAKLPPEIMEKLAGVDEVKSELQKLKEEREDKLLESEIDTLRKKYPNEDWETDSGEGTLLHQILKKANETGLTDLNDVYKIMRFDQIRTNTEAQTKKQITEEQINNAKKGIVGAPGSQKPAPKTFDTKTPWSRLDTAAMLEAVNQT